VSPTLNERAWVVAEEMVANAELLRITVHETAGARVLDCGVKAEGGLRAGLGMARICLADLGEVSLVPGDIEGSACPHVQVTTDQPVLACMASQYAGWQVKPEKFFGMGSGPMRAAYGKEELFEHIGYREQPSIAVGVLEAHKLPTEPVIAYLSARVQLIPDDLTLLVAPTSSTAGGVQVVARSVEMALHKLHELKFDLGQVVSGYGIAPLPPASANDLIAMGRVNDAVLYGGRVVLWVRSDDAVLAEVGPKVPSSSSCDHGAPFAELFERAGGDFYKIDPMLFSPAELVVYNLASGRSHRFGKTTPDVLLRSFFGG
jgi:methenyltetrahydromethanopterin cyclohydrolase